MTKQKLPSRKAGLAAVIMRHLEGDRLQTVWQSLDELQRAAVAEVVHSGGTYFPADQFRAKYGSDPVWESSGENRYWRNPSPLRFFFYGGVMPEDLKKRLMAFVPPPAKTKIAALDHVPATFDIPYERWNAVRRISESHIEQKPLAVRETERVAQRELISILRLIDAGRIARRANSSFFLETCLAGCAYLGFDIGITKKSFSGIIAAQEE